MFNSFDVSTLIMTMIFLDYDFDFALTFSDKVYEGDFTLGDHDSKYWYT